MWGLYVGAVGKMVRAREKRVLRMQGFGDVDAGSEHRGVPYSTSAGLQMVGGRS